MALKADLESEVRAIFESRRMKRDGQAIPIPKIYSLAMTQ
jgi:hypothetical protein